MTNEVTNQFADIVTTAVNAPGAIDASKETKGGFDKKPARAGVALFRMLSYIEKGEHTVKSGQGKGKKQNMADITFELVHPEHMIGPDDKKFPDTITVRNLNISMNPKAKYFKLFKKMNYTGAFTSFSQMLGHAFLGSVVHNVVGDTTYVNMEADGQWLIGPPRYCADPINAPEALTEVNVPEMSQPPMLFLFDNPGVDAGMVTRMWDSISISGEKNDGTPLKDWRCDMIRSANNFQGSFIQSVVGGDAIVVDDLADAINTATDAAIVDAADGANQIADATPHADTADANVADPLAVTQDDVADPLAGLAGL